MKLIKGNYYKVGIKGRFILCSALILIALLNISRLGAQTSILIYSQNFEGSQTGVLLNTTGAGTNVGTNVWIVNDLYKGGGNLNYPDTPSQDSTVSGTITGAPYSNYLHIYDKYSGIKNCNYEPTKISDKFVMFTSDGVNGFCTLGMTNVNFTFFYLAGGSATAYATLYYSVNRGPWIQTGNKYFDQRLWKYEIVTDTAFNNKTDVRFGIRWKNNAGDLPGKMSFGIDDIFIVGDFDNFNAKFNVNISSVSPTSVCPNDAVTVIFTLTTILCANGFFEMELSDSTGSFSKPVVLGLWEVSNRWTFNILNGTIPKTTPPGKCYKIRFHYTDADYKLDFYTEPSTVCIIVKSCPNIITIPYKPVVLRGNDSICVGSVIDIAFNSTGTFKSNNLYIAELSDSSGAFPSTPNVIGSIPDGNAYPGTPPGNISGLINENNNPITDGCKYYIRVRSTSPPAVSAIWGPFCIYHCDMESNKKKDIQACIKSCKAAPAGFSTDIYLKTHSFDSTAKYSTGNKFLVEVHNSSPMGSFEIIPPVGALGKVTAVNDTTVRLHVPCADSLGYLGLKPGMYYLRIIATNSNHRYDLSGTIVRLMIGYPADNLHIIRTPPDSLLCVGDAVFFQVTPSNQSSTYKWQVFINGRLATFNPPLGSGPSINILFNSAGTIKVTIQETNYGCKGPLTPLSSSLTILNPPTAKIVGPKQACLGDTLYYNTKFESNVYYAWNTNGSGKIIDTSNNILHIRYNKEGVFKINLMCLNKCGQALSNQNVIITKHPDASFAVQQPVCSGTSTEVKFTGTPVSPSTFKWNFEKGKSEKSDTSRFPHDVTWSTAGKYKVSLAVTKYGCTTKDSVNVDVIQTPTKEIKAKTPVCPFVSDNISYEGKASDSAVFSWNFIGANISRGSTRGPYSVTWSKTGKYDVSLLIDDRGCSADTAVVIDVKCDSLEIPNVVIPNGSVRANNIFNIKGIENYPNSRLLIFNRWGEKIYETSNYQNDWNGESHPEGGYFYLLYLPDGSMKKGTVTIIRR